jgi:hypothetical protein
MKTKLLFFLLTLTLFSCDDGVYYIYYYGKTIDTAFFENKKTAWEARGINHYRFTARMDGSYGFGTLYQVTVFPNRKTEIAALDSEMGIDLEKPFSPLTGKTIDELYASIDDGIKNLKKEKRGAWIGYNKEYHYPEVYGTGPINDDPNNIIVGGWLEFKITGFEVLDDAE